MIHQRYLLFCILSLLGAASAWAESIFPLRKDLAAGRALPPPYSIGIDYVWQDQNYDLSELTLVSPLPLPPVGQLAAENETSYRQIRGGLWVLPFLQVYGLAAKANTDTLVKNVPLIGDLRIKRKGSVLGAGAVLAAGWGRTFVSLDANYVHADLESHDNTIKTATISPRLGYTFGPARGWIGTMYQRTKQRNHGHVAVPLLGGDVDYRSLLEASDPWNALLGGSVDFGRRWQFILEGGFGKRRQWIASLDFKW